MQSKESVVRVALEIDRDRADYLTALAALRGVSVETLTKFFLVDRLNHPNG